MKLIFTYALFLSFLPFFSINIGYIPLIPLLWASIFFFHIFIQRNHLVLDGIKYFVLFGFSILISQVNSDHTDETFTKSLIFAFTFATIPIIGEYIHKNFKSENLIYFAVFFNVFFTFYNIIFSTLSSKESLSAKFGPLEISITSSGFFISILTSMIFIYAYNLKNNRKVKYLLYLLVCLNIYTYLFHLGNRTGLLAILISILLYLFIKIERSLADKIKFLAIISISIFITIQSILILNEKNIFPEFIKKRIESSINLKGDSSGLVRLANFYKALELIQDYPLFGGGYLNFIYYDYGIKVELEKDTYTRLVGKDNVRPHSLYTTIIGETGFFGIISFLLLLNWTILKIKFIIENNKESTLDFLWAWIPAWLVFSTFHDGFNTAVLFFWAFFYNVYLTVKKQTAND